MLLEILNQKTLTQKEIYIVELISMEKVTEHEKLMSLISNITDLQFDGGDGETRLHYDKERINVFAQHMTKRAYSKMCKEINKKSIKGSGFEVYAWNDASSYAYWKDDSSGNYIQITANINITTLGALDSKALVKACEEMHNYFYDKYDNTDYHFNQASSE